MSWRNLGLRLCLLISLACRYVVHNGSEKFDPKSQEHSQVVSTDLKYNVVDGQNWGSMRSAPISRETKVHTESAVAHSASNGEEKSLQWHEGSVQNEDHQEDGKVTVAVKYATVVGPKQKLVAFAGTTAPCSQPVIGVVSKSTPLSTHLSVDEKDVISVPKNIPLADAAALVQPFSVSRQISLRGTQKLLR